MVRVKSLIESSLSSKQNGVKQKPIKIKASRIRSIPNINSKKTIQEVDKSSISTVSPNDKIDNRFLVSEYIRRPEESKDGGDNTEQQHISMPDISLPQDDKLIIHIKDQSNLDAKIDGIFQTPKSKTDTNLSGADESIKLKNANDDYEDTENDPLTQREQIIVHSGN